MLQVRWSKGIEEFLKNKVEVLLAVSVPHIAARSLVLPTLELGTSKEDPGSLILELMESHSIVFASCNFHSFGAN